jgi:hypothetical protein
MEKNNVKTVLSLISVLALVLIINACTVYKQPAMKITSVLAVTAEGDTLKLPIDVIRPIYNYNNYPRSYYPYNNFYYTPNRYYPSYGQHSNNNNNTTPNYTTPSSSSFGGTGSVGNSGGNPNVSTPPPNPAAINPKKNN